VQLEVQVAARVERVKEVELAAARQEAAARWVWGALLKWEAQDVGGGGVSVTCSWRCRWPHAWSESRNGGGGSTPGGSSKVGVGALLAWGAQDVAGRGGVSVTCSWRCRWLHAWNASRRWSWRQHARRQLPGGCGALLAWGAQDVAGGSWVS
jgi:hypothetical protein